MDYRKGKPDDRAQILQLEFMNELYYKNKATSLEMECSNRRPKPAQADAHGDKDEGAAGFRDLFEDSGQRDSSPPQIVTHRTINTDNGPAKALEEGVNANELKTLQQIQPLKVKSNITINLSQLSIMHVLIPRWRDVAQVLIARSNSIEDRTSDAGGSAYQSAMLHYRAGQMSEIRQSHIKIARQHAVQENRRLGLQRLPVDRHAGLASSVASSEPDDHGDGSSDEDSAEEAPDEEVGELELSRHRRLSYAFCKIFEPTCVRLLMQEDSEVGSHRYASTIIETEPIKMKVNFRDLDFMYLLYKRYETDITASLEIMADPYAPEVQEQFIFEKKD